MSTAFPARAATRTAPATGRAGVRPARPRLTVVDDRPFKPPRMPFVLFVVVLLGAGLIGLLLLNTELQRGTFEVTDLNKQAKELRDQQEDLERQVRTLESPQHLAAEALRLGMVPNPNPVFLRLPDGQVLGVPAAGEPGSGATVYGPPLPKPVVKPPAVKPPVEPATTAHKTLPTTTKPPTATGTRAATEPSSKPARPPKPTGQLTTTPSGG
jgi:cell division protein FtsB